MIGKIFSDYKKICEERKDTGNHNIPILLFNEADAVLQKRTKNVHVSIEKTENAIQNIILENMEKFEGILIATTNLAINLDEAFERRFLYKIEFQNPPLEAKTSIWHSKLNWLSTDNAKILAKKYNFSGGEIDNIVRKATLEEILTRKQVSLNKLEEMCVNEKLHTDNPDNRIGFVLDNEDCF